MISNRAFHPQLVEKKIAVAENGGEKIIEVVRDAAGELAERFHFLRTNELILELFAGRHVHERADESDRFAIAVADDVRPFEQVEIRAVQMTEPVFPRPLFARVRQGVANARDRARPVLRMNLLLPEADVAGVGRAGVTEQSFEALGPGERAAGYSPNPNSIIRSLGSERKMFRDFSRAFR